MKREKKSGKELCFYYFKSLGYTIDRYGNLVSPNGEYRVKMNANKARYEKKIKIEQYGKMINQWIRIRSAFYSQLTINSDNGKISGFKR